MRIALFSDSYIPIKNGLSTLLYQFKHRAESDGHHVTLVTPRFQGWHADDDTILLTNSFPLGVRIEQRGALVNQIDINREMQRRRIEIIHTHTESALGLSGRRAAKALGLPMLHTLHTFWEDYAHYFFLIDTQLSRWIVRWYLRRYLQPFRTIVVPSLKAERYVSEITSNKEVHVIPNAMDIGLLSNIEPGERAHRRRTLRAELGIAEDTPLLLFVGRLGKEKRIDVLLSALCPLFKRYPHLQMLIAGAGPLLPKLRMLAQKQHLTNRIHLAGFVGWERIFDYYLAGDIFVTASLSETHSMVLIEAVSSGLPIVARTDSGANDHVVHHAENGYLADNERHLCNYLSRLIDDPLLRHHFGQRSLQYAAEYNIARNVERTLTLYNAVIAGAAETESQRVSLI